MVNWHSIKKYAAIIAGAVLAMIGLAYVLN